MKKTKILTRISAWLLVMVMLMSTMLICPLTASAATITKTEKSYDIAVVYDNSGSMYIDGDGMGWCRAKYAMEIFASMLNYDKDKLSIFPMWQVTWDGSMPTTGGSFAPISIKNESEIDKISNLYTVNPGGTPFAPVDEAHSYLKKSSANEKWLIVLTDGAFNQDKREGGQQTFDVDFLEKKLSALASDDIKVQYLGFGKAAELKADASRNFFAKKSSDTSLKDDLIGICNSIFQRSVLPANRLSGTTLKLDLSMKNLIVFAQGESAKITSLKDSSEKEIPITLNSGQRKYSEIKAKGYENAPVDRTLAGQVVTFDACAKEQYTLSYSGADAIQIFYEPDVDIDVSLKNSDGVDVSGSTELAAGEYTLTSRIVDSHTGEDVTSHELMGNDVKLRTFVKTSKDADYVEYANGSKITFEPDDETDIYIEGEYLGKYKIVSSDSPTLAWLKGIKFEEPKPAFKLTFEAEQTWYTIKDHAEWKPVKVSLSIDGQPLTDEQMAKTKLNVTTDDGLLLRTELIPGESAYNIFISEDAQGKYIEPATGKYKLTASATYVDEDGKTQNSEKAEQKIEIQLYTKLVRTLFVLGIILIILIILAIITFILHKIKVFPNNIDTDNAVYKKGGQNAGTAASSLTVTMNTPFKKKGSINVRASRGTMGISLAVEAVHPLFRFPFKYQKPARRSYRITGVSASNMDYVSINGTKYTKQDYSEVNELAYDQTTVQFEKRVSGEKYFVKTDLVNK